MESPEYSPTNSHMMDASRPSLGFPLGTALLLLIVFSLSGVFSCCYHCEKLRSLRTSYSEEDDDEDVADLEFGPVKTKRTLKSKKAENKEQSFTVVMPGDKVAKFIAMPCPCQPPRQPVESSLGRKPSKSSRIALPLYQQLI